MKQIRTEIAIKAPSKKVWNILMDFGAYGEWNPFIQSISGEGRVNTKLSAFLKPPDMKGMNIKPKVIKMDEGREFRWCGHLLFPGLFDGEHIFELRDENGGTVFVQREEFKGLFSSSILKKVGHNTLKGFEEMNHALKALAEKK